MGSKRETKLRDDKEGIRKEGGGKEGICKWLL